MARPLVQFHSYAHLYLLTLSLHGPLFEVYIRQVWTIGGATLHPPEILELGGHGDTLHARTQLVAAHDMPRTGGDIPCSLLEGLSQFFGGI